ncbi:proteasome subunit alpha type-2-like [Drosophila serrata]|uniref:proteasome subunit alpha type-2-like n=1 Tax=Drosophila serrata TaxID=7274 RepID=UPI000A1D3938|nr:proteasome subunit alpha type-2-like [Drosophila serrata]
MTYEYHSALLSAERRNVQLENARAAIDLGSISVAITACSGVVIAADKTPPSPLYDVDSVRRVEMIAKHIGMVYSGVDPDYRILVIAARKVAQLYYLTHMNLIPVKELAKCMAIIMTDHTNLYAVRPFGVSLLICGWSDGCPQVYKVDPSGLYSAWKAYAQGKNAVHSNNMLVDRYNEVLNTDDAVYTALQVLWQSGCEMISDNIEIAICSSNGYRRLDHGSIQKHISRFCS